jgi:hypothetical protein
MKIDKNIIFTLTILCLVIIIPAALSFRKLPTTELLPSEKMFLNFSSAPVAVFEPRQQPAFSGSDCPVKAPPRPPVVITKNLPPIQIAAVKPPPSLPKVSLIYFEDDSTKKAIIGGNIMQVGSTVDHYKVLKIETTRVQIRSAGKDIWLNVN